MSEVRIIAWNCGQGLRRKTRPVLDLEPDVAVIAECGPEERLGESDLVRVGWTGRNLAKGLAIFATPALGAIVDQAWDPLREWFLPVRLDAIGVDVIAVWAMNHRGNEPGPRRGRTHRAIEYYEPILRRGRAVVIGDFNDNARWDTRTYPSFARTVALMGDLGYVSVHHERSGEPHGAEQTASFLWQRKPHQRYLIDHAFIPRTWLGHVMRFGYESAADWLRWSDHVPVVLDLALPAQSA